MSENCTPNPACTMTKGDGDGWTLRDWFAGQALAGWLPTYIGDGKTDAASVARDAYEMADAMLAERAKESKP